MHDIATLLYHLITDCLNFKTDQLLQVFNLFQTHLILELAVNLVLKNRVLVKPGVGIVGILQIDTVDLFKTRFIYLKGIIVSILMTNFLLVLIISS